MSFVSTRASSLLFALLVLACDRRTAEEKGKDYAKEKLDFAQGAADVLKQKGGELGKTAGKGVGELVKGVGSGVKDAAQAEVKVSVDASGPKLVVHRAQESGLGDHGIDLFVEASADFQGTLSLLALGDANTELGEGKAKDAVSLRAGEKAEMHFFFPEAVRLSHVASYRLVRASSFEVSVAPELKTLTVSQLTVAGEKVTVYGRFAANYGKALTMLAFDASGTELGRAKLAAKAREADSAEYLEFAFDPRTPLSKASRFEVR